MVVYFYIHGKVYSKYVPSTSIQQSAQSINALIDFCRADLSIASSTFEAVNLIVSTSSYTVLFTLHFILRTRTCFVPKTSVQRRCCVEVHYRTNKYQLPALRYSGFICKILFHNPFIMLKWYSLLTEAILDERFL